MSLLQTSDNLLTILVAIIKQNNDKIEIHDNDLRKVTTSDCLIMAYDKKENKLILRVKNNNTDNTTKNLN